jgi:outer membrane protein assembly factor BamE (lipoprotein component of BamABCDE complex)
MLKTRHMTFPITLAALFFAGAAIAAEEPAKKDEAAEPVIVGNPPAESPFGQLKIGMSYEEVLAIVGKPTSENSWCTGKQHIPFYFGSDRGRAEANFKGMGQLKFNSDVTVYPFRICKADKPTTLIHVLYDPDSTGELAK